MTLLQLIAHLKEVYERDGNYPKVMFLNRESEWVDLQPQHFNHNEKDGEPFLEVST